MKKIFILFVGTVMIFFRPVQLYSSEGEKQAIVALVSLPTALLTSMFIIGSGSKLDISWGSIDQTYVFAGRSFSGKYTDVREAANPQYRDASFTGWGWQLARLVKHNRKEKWFGYISPGYEFDGEFWLTNHKQVGNMEFSSGANFIMYESEKFFSPFRVTCGIGYTLKFYTVLNNYYIRPGLDVKITDFLTANLMFYKTIFGKGVTGDEYNVLRNTGENRIEFGGSMHLIREGPWAMSLGFRLFSGELDAGNGERKYSYNGTYIGLFFPD